VVDALADIFRATDVSDLLQDFGKATGQNDPIIHFYETFLAEFDPDLRKKRGVWYTPEPVVNFIVRAVDDILKDEFGLKDGLADTSKTTVKINTNEPDKRTATGYKQIEQEVHKVQILDPAVGTGTFLAEVIKQIYTKFEGQEGIWPGYVENHLIPRLNGFEILMASYAMAHLKLDMLLRETGVERNSNKRFRVYLTNSLEEHHPDTGTLFAGWLSHEANEANHVKRDTPVMVVMGNPPYSVSSSNKGEWIRDLIRDYKKNLNEKKLNLDDDYIKFIRYGEHFIEKNGEGVLAYISNNSFLDGITHRQMRKHLLETFDKIYVLDLHGSYMKNEMTPNGGKDENVFDIQQGVSISLFIKNDLKNRLADVHHSDLFGCRVEKYEDLFDYDIRGVQWEILDNRAPYYFFIPKNFGTRDIYEKGFQVNALMDVYNSGIQTDRDTLFVDFEKEVLQKRISTLLSGQFSKSFKEKFRVKDSSSYKITDIIKDKTFSNSNIFLEQYRPFDYRYIYYDPKLISRPGEKAAKHFINEQNVGLQICKQQSTFDFQHILASRHIVDRNSISIQTKEATYFFPLYLYPGSAQQTLDGNTDRKPNIDPKIVGEIADNLGLEFTAEPSSEELSERKSDGTFAPIDLLDYIYAVLHSPSYREKYKEFLKIDFPRVPNPDDPEIFWNLVKLGGELRRIHLLEHPVVDEFITTYPVDSDNTITHRLTKTDPGFVKEQQDDEAGKVWINDKQYFGNVPEKAWEFYIGGYQPAQKWLKDRRDRTLDYEDIAHYQKIIVALMETDRLMGEIDEIEFE